MNAHALRGSRRAAGTLRREEACPFGSSPCKSSHVTARFGISDVLVLLSASSFRLSFWGRALGGGNSAGPQSGFNLRASLLTLSHYFVPSFINRPRRLRQSLAFHRTPSSHAHYTDTSGHVSQPLESPASSTIICTSARSQHRFEFYLLHISARARDRTRTRQVHTDSQAGNRTDIHISCT
jgi:hypothetical protein